MQQQAAPGAVRAEHFENCTIAYDGGTYALAPTSASGADAKKWSSTESRS
jgi:hypothetical protein